MKNPLLKKALPHLFAIAIFILTAVLFCKPVLDGNVLNQDDITKWKGIAQNSFEYKEKNGHFPLWNPNVFSGMPNYQIAMEGKSILPDMVKVFSLGLPKPMNFFFLAALCFYILAVALGISPVAGILGALAYAFSTYNPVVIHAGHDTQMLATAFMPLLLAGLICTYEKKYWLGIALTTYGAYQQIGVNHLQITYYMLLIAFAITIAYLVTWIRNKEWKHIFIAGAISIVAGLIGLMGNSLSLLTTSEYAKYTMRGGKDIDIKDGKVSAVKTSGLDTGYAFEYSLGKAESFTLLMPDAFGGGGGRMYDENSHVVQKLVDKGVPEATGQQIAQSLPKYWGGLPFTAGPAYLGVFLCLFGLIGFVILKTPLRWALLAMTVFGILISWGKHLAGFNTFLFEHLPLYNKFRAPSMAQVIPQLTIAIVAVLTIQKLFFEARSRELLQQDFKKILYAVGGLFLLLTLMYIGMDYGSPIDPEISSSLTQQSGSPEIGRAVIEGLKADRKGLFGGELLRALLFAAVLIGVLYLYMKNMIKQPLIAVGILLVIGSGELMFVSKEYLPNDAYVAADDLSSEHFTPSALETAILNDKDPDFRVMNVTVNPLFDARTSTYFKSVTGYHPARLRIYQDLMDKYLSGSPNRGVVNMLNAKYLIVPDSSGNGVNGMPNPEAYGPCWLVKNVKLVDTKVDAFQAIGTTDLRDTAIVEKAFSNLVTQPVWDSASSLKLKTFSNDTITYDADLKGAQFAVFSEIYYPKGWNAYVDGKKTEYVNTNYALRGISLPAGKHEVKFIFEPESVATGIKLMYIASILIALLLVGGLFMQWWQDKKKAATTA